MKDLMEASLARLSNWDISPAQLERLQKEGARRTLTLSSPANGVVMERKAVAGMRFMPGEALFQIADVSSVWVIAELYEQDIGLVKVGQEVKVKVNAYPEREFAGKVAFVYPTLNPQTRTGQVRVELANREGLLKPAMYASLELATSPVKTRVVTVPDSAVLRTGTRELVIIQVGEGRFEPRPVKLGMKSDHHVQVLDGVGEGEQVVVSANFLLDAESNLKAALAGFTPGGGNTAPKPVTGHQTTGKVERVDLKDGSATITHEPIPSLNWPAMTMTFKADETTLKQLKAGDTIQFEFAEKGAGNWTVLKVLPAGQEHAKHQH
jgi:Cu/Ag efflux protein CusF